MDRQRWLAERRAEVERSYTDEAPTYDDYDPATPVHRRFVLGVLLLATATVSPRRVL